MTKEQILAEVRRLLDWELTKLPTAEQIEVLEEVWSDCEMKLQN